jgi:hypothetical protein
MADPPPRGSDSEGEPPGSVDAPPSSAVASMAGEAKSGPSSLVVIAILVGVFGLGGVAGGFVGRSITLGEYRRAMTGPSSEVRIRFRIEAMRHAIDLTDDQVKRITELMKASEGERDTAMQDCHPAMDALREKVDAQILEVLTPDQRPRYEEYSRNRHRK